MKKNLVILGMVGFLILELSATFLWAEKNVQDEKLIFLDVPLVYAASRIEQKIMEAPASVTIITYDEIKRYGYQTLGEVLQNVTGFYVTNDRNYMHTGVRGFQIPGDYSSRILLLINGHTMQDPTYGGTGPGHEIGIDLNSVKKIEIIRGPGSALYGTYALFAVINVVTKDGKDVDGVEISAQYGSYQSKKGSLSYGKKLANGLEVFVSGSLLDTKGQDLYFPEFDDPATNNGVFENGDREKMDTFLTKLSYGDFILQAGAYRREKGIPTGSFETIFNDNRSKTVDENRFVEIGSVTKLDETKDLLAKIYYRGYFYEGDYIYWYEDEVGEFYKEDCADWTKNDWIGSELQFNWKTSEKNRLTFGGEYQNCYTIHQKNYDKGLLGPEYYYDYLDDNRDLEVKSLYIQDIYKVISTLSFTLGGRYDYYSTFGETINPRLGIVYNPLQRSVVKMLYGSAFRAPTFYEMYYTDGYYSIKPNPDIEPEELKTYEVVFEQGITKNIEGVSSFYLTNIANGIYQIESEELSAETGEPLLQFTNSGKSEVRGVELSVKGRWKSVEGKVGYSLQKSKNKNTDKELTNFPRSLGNFGISIPFFQKKIYLSTAVRYIGKRLTIDEEWLDPYLCTDLSLFSSKVIPKVEITVKVNNLFDESYAEPSTEEFIQNKIPQNRRNFILKVGYRF